MGNRQSSKPIYSSTWFDTLPTEIIIEIFDYLSSNDIIYTFLDYSPRLNEFILKRPHYLTLELPILNSPQWNPMISNIGSKILCLKIVRYDPSMPLNLFPNIKSIIIYSSYNLAEEQLRFILKCNQFKYLNTLKIKSDDFFTHSLYNYSTLQINLLEHIFSIENHLTTFEYSPCIPSMLQQWDVNLEINLHLKSLTLHLSRFIDLISISRRTPSLTYLNIRSNPPYEVHQHEPWSNVNIPNLKEFHLKFNDTFYGTNRFSARRINFYEVIYAIKRFSSSLECLSLNLLGCYIESSNDFPFNGIRLEREFLESMTQLKQFHLYAILNQKHIDRHQILLTFQTKFWSDHNWAVAMCDGYLYTIPFYFDKFYAFKLKTNQSKPWSNVKLIRCKNLTTDLLKRIKIQTPKLISLSIDYFNPLETIERFHYNQCNNNIILKRIETVHFLCGSLEYEKEWLINSLPNLKKLVLVRTKFPPLKDDVSIKLMNKIERLNINGNDSINMFTDDSCYTHFSNLQDLQFEFEWTFDSQIYSIHADTIMKCLTYFKRLQTLSILYNPFIFELTRSTPSNELKNVFEKLNINIIEKMFVTKYTPVYIVFLRKA